MNVQLSKAEVDAILNRYTKKKRGEAARDAKHDLANKEIFGSLEDNTAYFLETIKDRINRYEENLREVISRRYPNAMKGDPLDTPLLRRTAMVTKAIGGEPDAPTPEQATINSAPKITIKLIRERFAASYGDNYSEDDMTAAMEALAKRSGGKRNRDGTMSTVPIEVIDPSIPREGKTLKAAPRGGTTEGEEGETITLDPNDPAVLKAILAAMLASKGKGGKGGKAEEEADDNMYEDSDASSGIDVAEDCEAPEIDFPDNSPLIQAYAALKKECYDLNITFQGVHDWIALNIQSASDDTEREQEVSESITGQIQEMQEQIGQIYDMLGGYLEGRVEMELAVSNYPHVTSYAQALLCADDDAWIEVERSWRELIRATLFIYYMVANNLESLSTIASPSGRGAHSIYQ